MTHYNLKLHFPFTISPHWSHFFPFFLFHLIISYFSKQHARLKVIFMILCYISPVSLFHESMVNARTLFGQIFSGRQLELSKFNLQTLITLMHDLCWKCKHQDFGIDTESPERTNEKFSRSILSAEPKSWDSPNIFPKIDFFYCNNRDDFAEVPAVFMLPLNFFLLLLLTHMRNTKNDKKNF